MLDQDDKGIAQASRIVSAKTEFILVAIWIHSHLLTSLQALESKYLPSMTIGFPSR